MKYIKCICISLICAVFSYSLAFEGDFNYRKACEYLDQMGEVYFKTTVNTSSDIQFVANTLSLDKIEGDNVYAYANRQEFEKFLSRKLYYEILPHPSTIGPKPVMSDYADVTFPLFDWDTYPTYEGYQNIMEKLKTTYPDKVNYEKIGESVRGRDLLMAQVTSDVGERKQKPKFLMNAGIHGNELLPIMMVMRLIDWLCSNYESDPRATKILDSIRLYVSPMLNPDGTYKGGDLTVFSSTRYNANNADLNRNYTRLPGLGTPSYEKETKIYMAFENAHIFVMQIGWHSGTEGISYPWSCVPRKHPDNAWYNYVSRNYANQAQDDGPSTFFDDINNGAGQGYHHLYPATGTEKDCLLFYNKCRSNCIESSTQKVLNESKLNSYWEYHRDAMLAYIQEILNGIRGTVVDEVTKVGLPAKIWVEGHDTNTDSSFVYADSSGGIGDYYRPIYEGTYDVTYSCEGCESKTVNNIKVENGKATVVDVELDCGSTKLVNTVQKENGHFTVIQVNGGVKINYGEKLHLQKAAVYNVGGKLVAVLQVNPECDFIHWNGLNKNHQPAGSGCYLINISTDTKVYTLPFVLSE